MDSNVSARYGQFTGGVLNVKTRKPLGAYGLSVNTACVDDSLTSFEISQLTRDKVGAASLAGKPEYQECKLGLTLDLPSYAGFNVMVSHNKHFSDVVNYKAATFGGGQYGQKSESETTLVKVTKDIGNLVALEAQYTHSPYSSEYQVSNQAENQIVSYGGGDRAKIGIKSIDLPFLGSTEWEANLSYSDDDSSRHAAPNSYTWPSSLPQFSVCSNANCSYGGFGNIEQNEKELVFDANIAWNIPYGTIRAGLGYEKVDANKVRGKDGYAFSTPVTSSAIVCSSTTDLACINGQVALTRMLYYKAYDIDVSVETANVWAEWDAKFGNLSVRAGVRGDYDDFLGNTDFAPRLTASYDFGRFEVFGGFNRYYSKSFLAYAIREQLPDSYGYLRTGVRNVYSDTSWTLNTHTKGVRYGSEDLDTPYKDEFAAGVNAELGWGINARLKYISREGKDEISISDRVSETFVNDRGVLTTYQQVKATNDGHSKYESASLELFKKLTDNHSISFNYKWSDTKSYGDTYFDEIVRDDVYYNGQVMSYETLANTRQQSNFNDPTLVNLGVNSRWFGGKLKTNLGLRWKNSYETIDSTGSSIRISGVSYDIYEKIKYKAATEVDLKLNYLLISEGRNKVNITADITNLLDKTQYPIARTATNPYEKGRTIWLGINYKY